MGKTVESFRIALEGEIIRWSGFARALQSGLTMGVALIALAATGVAVGVMVANLQSYENVLGLAKGGVVDHPTFALIGEA